MPVCGSCQPDNVTMAERKPPRNEAIAGNEALSRGRNYYVKAGTPWVFIPHAPSSSSSSLIIMTTGILVSTGLVSRDPGYSTNGSELPPLLPSRGNPLAISSGLCAATHSSFQSHLLTSNSLVIQRPTNIITSHKIQHASE
jgi:hypothetical protein